MRLEGFIRGLNLKGRSLALSLGVWKYLQIIHGLLSAGDTGHTRLADTRPVRTAQWPFRAETSIITPRTAPSISLLLKTRVFHTSSFLRLSTTQMPVACKWQMRKARLPFVASCRSRFRILILILWNWLRHSGQFQEAPVRVIQCLKTHQAALSRPTKQSCVSLIGLYSCRNHSTTPSISNPQI